MLFRLMLMMLLLATGVSTNVAAARYYPSINAGPIVFFSLPLAGNGTYVFETDDLKPSSNPCIGAPDTQLVVRAPDGKFYSNDNYLTSKRSRVTFLGSSGFYTVYVFAATDTRCGKTDVYFTMPGGTRAKFLDDVEFGGKAIQPTGLPSGREYVFQTAHNPGGPKTTQILLFSSDWQLKAQNSSGGVLGAARLKVVYASYDRVVVGTPMLSSSRGSTALLIDDCYYTPDTENFAQRTECHSAGRDADSDNLSDALEAELGTNPKRWDTDGDGLFDYHEVVGRMSAAGDVPLRMLGANPRRRDLFVEVDSRYQKETQAECDSTPDPFPNPLSEAAIESVQARLFDLPRLPPNPDGTHGIFLHVDRGAACTNGTLCGDWGGSQNWGCAVGKRGVAQYAAIYEITCDDDGCNRPDPTEFRKERWELFRYALRWPAGSGQSYGASLWFNGSSTILAHELGHTMGLAHWGSPTLTPMNFKFNYPSIMNYAFQNTSGSRFSEGRFAPIDHRAMNELQWSPGLDKSYLTASKFGVRVCQSADQCPGAADPADAVDWNGDGRFTAGGVRFDISPLNTGLGGAGWPHKHDAQVAGAPPRLAAAASPALAYWEGSPGEFTAYAFYVATTGELRFSKLAPGSTVWSAWASLPVSFQLAHGGATAAATHTPFNRILIVHPQAGTGKLGSVLFDPESNSVISSSVIPNWPTGVVATQANLSKIGQTMNMVFRDTATSEVWLAHYAFAWLDFTRLVDASGVLKSRATPGITVAADGRTYLLTQNMTANRLDLYSRDGSGNFSIVTDSGVSSAMGGATHAASRIHLLFLPYLTGSGAKFDDNSGYLAAFYNDDYLNDDADPEPRWMRAYLPGYIAPGGAQFLGRATRRSQYQVLNQLTGTAIAAAQHGPHAGVLYIRENDVASLQYVPYANGIPEAAYPAHQDNDDAAVIHAQMCGMLVLGCPARCSNAFAANPYGAACAVGSPFESGPCSDE